VTTTTSPTPVDIAVRFMEESDPMAWKKLIADDARFKDDQGVFYGDSMQSGHRFAGDDFDRDGSTSLGDRGMWNIAFGNALRFELLSLECITNGTEVTCTVSETDALFETAGVEPVPYTVTVTVEDGLVTEWEPLWSDTEAAARAGSAWWEQLLAYEQWVSDTHPDQQPELFHEPCCEGDLIELPETIPLHGQLIAEWLGLGS
jgi:hypothetical protein